MSEEIDTYKEEAGDGTTAIYSEIAVDHATRPRNVGPMQQHDGCATITGPCGDTMQIWLRVRKDTIIAAAFMTDGCASSIASGSMVTEMAKGKTASDALRISQENILDALGGLPEDSRHCALLASDTLKAALRDYAAFKNEPWKRNYRS